MNRRESQVLVVGGGGAGLSAAAAAAQNGAKTVVIDENPGFGGQIWRKSLTRVNTKAARLVSLLESRGVELLPATTVFDRISRSSVAAELESESIEFEFEKLIIATGARERFLPFPGWTLQNVFGVGGLQALVKGGYSIKNKRIVIAGTGPLLPAVAEFLVDHGGKLVIIAEQARLSSLIAFGYASVGLPSKLSQAVKLLPKTLGRYRTGSYVSCAFGDEGVNSVEIESNRTTVVYDCDILATGFHLVPNLELPRLFGLNCTASGCKVDRFQRTSNNQVFAVGETTGVGGIELAQIEGTIAGLSAVGADSEAAAFFKKRSRYQRFSDALEKAFLIRQEILELSDDETLVCRCEDVSFGRLREFRSWRDAKLKTRCGMGPCQGRICGAATELLFGWSPQSVRSPIVPVKAKS